MRSRRFMSTRSEATLESPLSLECSLPRELGLPLVPVRSLHEDSIEPPQGSHPECWHRVVPQRRQCSPAVMGGIRRSSWSREHGSGNTAAWPLLRQVETSAVQRSKLSGFGPLKERASKRIRRRAEVRASEKLGCAFRETPHRHTLLVVLRLLTDQRPAPTL